MMNRISNPLFRAILLGMVLVPCGMLSAQQTIVTHHSDIADSVEKTEERTTLVTSLSSPDSLVRVHTTEVRHYVDTLYTLQTVDDSVAVREVHEEMVDSTDRRGHYVQAYVGGGYSSLGYHLQADNRMTGAPSGLLQLQYAYYFHPNWGIGVGLWMENYTSHAYLSGDRVLYEAIDSDSKGAGAGEKYTHHATIRAWHERQTLHNVAVPVSLQAQVWNSNRSVGLFAAIGAAPAYSVMRDYRIMEGRIEHWGQYDKNAELHNMHEFQTIDYLQGSSAVAEKGKVAVRMAGTAFVDLGMLVRLSEQIDMMVGVYGHYTVNNVNGATPHALGWKDDQFPNLDMEEYEGVLATTEVANGGALHPWAAGVKIGLHWHYLPKPRTEESVWYEHTVRMDTVVRMQARSDTLYYDRTDTLRRMLIQQKEELQIEINRLNRVYFTFDSYELSEESKSFLREIADKMQRMPNRFEIGGHASKEGTQTHNARLARNRAIAVRDYLVSLGVAAERLDVRDYGSRVANAINLSEDLSLDRRVEIIVLDE